MLARNNAAIAALVAVALGGCVATDMLPLNTSYDVLSQKELTTSKLDHRSKEYLQGRDEVQAGYKTLAANALKASGESGQTPATKVAALRLAAVAAWKGGDDDIYSQAQPAGQAACGQLPAGTGGAPRDCALLFYLPTLRVIDELTAAYNDVNTPGPVYSDATVQALTGKLPLFDRVRQSQEALLDQITAGSAPFTSIGPSTVAFFKKVAFDSACLAKLYFMFGNQASRQVPEPATRLSADGQAVAGRFSNLLVKGGVLSAPDPTWYKDSRIVCTGL